MRKSLDDYGRSGWRLRLAGELMAGCDRGGHILRANLPLRRIVRQLGISSPQKLLPADHCLSVIRSLASGRHEQALAVFDGHQFHWSYRRLARRGLVCVHGRYVDGGAPILPDETVMLAGALGQLAFGVMVVDAALAVRFANPCATMLLESAWPGAIRNGRLFESHGEFRGALEPLVERGEGALVLHRDTGQAPLELMVSSFADRPAGTDPAEDRLALVWIVDPDYVPTSYHESLRDLYGVTPAESRVAEAVRRGMRLEESAQQLGISHATIRTHVRKLCEKLTAERKAELLWRLNGCAAALLVATDWMDSFKDLF